MKKLLVFLIILFSLTSNIVWSADAQKGVEAVKSGDYATALYEWKPLAEQGHTVAQYGMGYLYKHGYGVSQNYKTAFKWFTLAAEQGLAHAQNNLGILYENGQGVSQDYKTAFKWFTLAAEQGFAPAQHNEKRIAAEQGLTHIQNNEKKIADAKKAEEKKKAEESKKIADAKKAEEKQLLDESSSSTVNEEYPSDAREQFVLGVKYHNGEGVEQDFRKAAKLWELSSEQGYADAQHALGVAYYSGKGVNKDDAIAFMWVAVSQTEFFIINGQPTGVNNSHRKKEYMLQGQERDKAKDNLSFLHANIRSSSDIIKGTGLASACWRQKFKNCESNHLTYSVESENKAKESGLPLCPEDDPNLMYQLKWDNCFGIGESKYGKYEGEFVNGLLHGNATFNYYSGDVYIGEYVEGRIEGQGSYYMVNGDKYEGMFRDYFFDGVGKYTYSDGRIEEGIWENSQLVESKKTNQSIPVEKEYVAIVSASVYKQPFDDSEVVKTIPKGATVFVISKTETNDWYLIKEIMENLGGDDIGEILGYSSADSFLSMEEITSNNNNTYSDSPGNLLINAYINYVVIKNMHSMREGYAVVYVNDSQMKKVKNQVIEIEKILVNEFSLDEDLLWDTAMKKYDKDYSMIDLFESTGIYTEDGNRVAMIALLSIDTIADEVIGSSSTKDF